MSERTYTFHFPDGCTEESIAKALRRFGNTLLARTNGATEQPDGSITANECAIPDPEEKNEGKRILQTQQNITCRLDSLEQLLISLQVNMQLYSPRTSREIRVIITQTKAIKENWLEDTRRAISHLSIDTKQLVESITNRPDTVRCDQTICIYPKCNCPGKR